MKNFDSVKEKRLLELLKEELDVFKQMKERAKEQGKLLVADEMDEFFKSIDLSDKLKEKINGLHQEKEPLMQSYLSTNKASKNETKNAVSALEESIGKVISECADLNKEIMLTASAKKDEYTMRLKELDTEKKTFNAYTMKMADNSEHFDKSM